MRLPRSVVPLATLAVVLGVPAVAGASGLATSDRLLVSPTQRVDGLDAGEAMGLNWVRGYTLPAAENPMLGNSAPCVRLGSHGKILVGVGYQPVPCTVDSNTTVLVWGLSNTCDTVDPLSPWYAVGERAQRACAVATIEPYVQEIRFTIDGGPAIDLHQRRFAIFAPQHRVRLRADNPFGVPPGPATFTAFGWMAWLNKLPPGRHTLRSESIFSDGSEPYVISIDLDVVRGINARDGD